MAPRTNDTEPEREDGPAPATPPESAAVAPAVEEQRDAKSPSTPQTDPNSSRTETNSNAEAVTTTAGSRTDTEPHATKGTVVSGDFGGNGQPVTAKDTVATRVSGSGGQPLAESGTGMSPDSQTDARRPVTKGATPLPETDGEPPATKKAALPLPAASGAEPSDTRHATPPQPVAGGAALVEGADERVAAVRRVSAAGRRLRVVQLGGTAVLLAVALTAGSIAYGAIRDKTAGTPVAAAPSAISPALLSSGSIDASIAALQAQLRAQPRDYGSWASLGLAYVEQARTKGDPSRYPQAEKALKRSLQVRPGNEQAITGQAALAAARHDFKDALAYADRILKENPYSQNALSSRIDALVELGRYADASKAADTADARRPGVPVFTRYAYVHELRGDVKTARRVLEQALATSTTPGDLSYVAAQLGLLAWNQGDYRTALTDYARALAADENYLPALEGRARAQWATGDKDAAIKGMEQLVARYPLPQPLVELGEMYQDRAAKGDETKARDQYALVDAWIALARANGVNADLDTALAAADHGDRAAALRAARAEWARRHTVHTADALAWALHVDGKDAEALPYARQATATGYRNASFIYHRGMIERATGHTQDARASLEAALKLNPGFSPLGAREARKALKDLEAAK
ncbi:tetratricopeptide repeat protein [Streptomyces sp. NPDC006668]|uniref:tetratricopeptide repeat protein n=1 Tax=Streptomyces sp. NPDC006668 TaxID=3156903 RepID=UPI003408DD8B